MITAVEVRDAIIAALNAAPVTESANAHSLGGLDAMATKPSFYTEVLVVERPAANPRGGGISPATDWRVLTRAVAQSEANAETTRARARARLLEAVITVGGIESTIITSPVTDNPITPDDGWFSGPAEWSLRL